MKMELPSADVKVDDAGQVNPVWYEKLKALADFANMFNFNPATLTNGQVLIYNSATKKFEPGAN